MRGRSDGAVRHSIVRRFLLIFGILSVVACSPRPDLHDQIGNNEGEHASTNIFRPPTIADLVSSIQCEIYLAAPPKGVSVPNAIETQSNHGNDDLVHLTRAEADLLTDQAYVASATLTADILVNEGLNPSLGFIVPRSVFSSGSFSPSTMFNLTKSLGGQWAETQHKQYTQQFTLDLAKPRDALNVSHCLAVTKALGSLGLAEILKSGLQYSRTDGLAYAMPGPSCDDRSLGKVADSARPIFGTTIDFAVTFGANGSATWALLRFKGPGGGGGNAAGSAGMSPSGGGAGSPGLINFSNVEKNILLISFAPASPGGPIIDPSEMMRGKIRYFDFIKRMQPDCAKRKAYLTVFGEYSLAGDGPGSIIREELADKTPNQIREIRADRLLGLDTQTLGLGNEQIEAIQSQQHLAIEILKEKLSDIEQGRSEAVRAAQQNNTQMILQNILISNP